MAVTTQNAPSLSAVSGLVPC